VSFAPIRETEKEGRTPSTLAAAVDNALLAFIRVTNAPRSAAAMLAAIIVWQVVVLYLKAATRPLWYDELLTLHVSSIHPFALLLKALRAGVDGMPAGYYAIVQLAKMLPIDPHVAVRLPSILGYILTLLGVYWFARGRLPALAALTAALLVTVSPFRAYAIEARSYSLLVGSLAIGAALWQRIGDKRFVTIAFGLLLMLAVSLHHLAVVAIATFGIAELLLTVLSNRIRWRVWAAIVAASCPFFVGLPTLLHFRALFGKNFWSQPTWITAVSTYETYLSLDQRSAFVVILFFALVLGSLLLRTWLRPREGAPQDNFSVPEVMLIGGFLFYPALLVVLTKLLGSGYVPRYGWPAILGVVLGLIYLIGRSVQPVAYLAGALLIACALEGGYELRTLAKADFAGRWADLKAASRDRPGIPVVVGSGLTYLEASEYAPPEVRERLRGVVSAEMAVRVSHMDTTDKAIGLLAGFVPLRVQELAPFEAAHQEFILCSGGPGDWLTEYLIERSYQLMKLPSDKDLDYSLYLVKRRVRNDVVNGTTRGIVSTVPGRG